MSKTEIQYEINHLQAKLRYIAEFDLWDRYDVRYLENRLSELKAELREWSVK